MPQAQARPAVAPDPDVDENGRLAALHRLGILDTAPEQEFDSLVELAAWAFGVETALVSLVDSDRQWFKAKVGLQACQTDRAVSFCTHAIRDRHVFVVPDATKDLRFRENPLVVGAPHIRFYAGAPLRLGSGHVVGTLCLIDRRPRADFSTADRHKLSALAGIVVQRLERRAHAEEVPGLQSTRTRVEEIVSAVDASFDGIAIAGADRRFVYLNRMHEQMFGYAPSELIGQPWDILYDKAEAARIVSLAFAELETSGTWRGEVVGRRKDGSAVHQEISLSRLSGGRTLCSTRDITERLEAERQRRELEAQLFQAQKLDCLGSLAGGIAHDFNNVLASIRGYTEFLREDLAGTEQARYVEKIQRAGERAQDLVKRILHFARKQEPRIEQIPIEEALEEAESLLVPTLGGRVHLTVRHDAGDLSIAADRTQLQQALVNLVVNARDAFEGGEGRILLASSRRTLDGGCAEGLRTEFAARPGKLPIRVSHDETGSRLWLGALPAAGEYLCVTILDEGAGMQPCTLERIFEPFFTTKPSGVGTGLGMASVLDLVLSARGAMTIDTAPGRGTTCKLLLACKPWAAGRESAEESKLSDVAPNVKQGARILIVDDDEDVGAVVQAAFRRQGFETRLAGGALEALEVLGGQIPYDAVLTDQRMPGMTGGELVMELRRRGFAGPVGMMSGFSEDLDERRALDIGADFWAPKPASGPLLVDLIRRGLAKRSCTASALA